jgi:hypothetical protein
MAETIWKPVLEADLLRTVMSPLLDAQRTAALQAGQVDPLPAAIEEAVATVRAEIQSCAGNSVSVDTSCVPVSLRDVACWMALERLATRLTVIKLTSDQVRAIEDARKKLERVAACKLAVEIPSEILTPASVQRGGGASVVEADTSVRTATRSQMDGL